MSQDRGRAWMWLGLFCATLLVGSVLEVGQAEARFLEISGPACSFSELTGHPCPGCGLARGTSCAIQGRWRQALFFHPGGFAVALICLFGVVLQIDVLRRGKRTALHAKWAAAGRVILTLSILVPWLLRLGEG